MSTGAATSRAAQIRAQLDHPVIDADGHVIELEPAVMDHLRDLAGAATVARYRKGWIEHGGRTGGGLFRWYTLDGEARVDEHATRAPWWALPSANTLDRATAMLPALFHERLPELGIDVAVLYPSLGLYPAHLEDDELRTAACRAFNRYYLELIEGYTDRLITVALIPMHTPAEALAELDHAVLELGHRAIMMPSHVIRPVPAVAQEAPELARHAYWVDTYGPGSAHDYDPVWARCVELGVAPTFHSNSMGWGARTTTSYVYNHIGQFAASAEAVCKALFLDGVTRRFPQLRCAFLEGGVGWATNLYADLVGHWRKRNRQAIAHLDPDNLDGQQLLGLCHRYGGPQFQRHEDELERAAIRRFASREDRATLDEFARCELADASDIAELFVDRFFFGCEADDPTNTLAFAARSNPFDARLGARRQLLPHLPPLGVGRTAARGVPDARRIPRRACAA